MRGICRLRRIGVRLILTGAGGLTVSAASAQPSLTPEDIRRDLTKLADDALASSNVEEGCKLFRAAYQIRASARLAREIAKCEETLGHHETALMMATACRDDAAKDKKDPDPDATRTECDMMTVTLRRHFGTLTLRGPGDAQKTGTTIGQAGLPPHDIFIDGRKVVDHTMPQRLLPGRHTVRAIRPGYEPFEREVTVTAGMDAIVTLETNPDVSPAKGTGQSARQGFGVDMDLAVTVSAGLQVRELAERAGISLGSVLSLDFLLPGPSFGGGSQIRPYGRVRNESLSRPVDGPSTATGMELQHIGGGFAFLRRLTRDNTEPRFGLRASLGGSASHIHSGSADGVYGGAFLSEGQVTGLHSDGWGFSFPEVALGVDLALPLSVDFVIGMSLSLNFGASFWNESAFSFPGPSQLCTMSDCGVPAAAEWFFGGITLGFELRASSAPASR